MQLGNPSPSADAEMRGAVRRRINRDLTKMPSASQTHTLYRTHWLYKIQTRKILRGLDHSDVSYNPSKLISPELWTYGQTSFRGAVLLKIAENPHM